MTTLSNEISTDDVIVPPGCQLSALEISELVHELNVMPWSETGPATMNKSHHAIIHMQKALRDAAALAKSSPVGEREAFEAFEAYWAKTESADVIDKNTASFAWDAAVYFMQSRASQDRPVQPSQSSLVIEFEGGSYDPLAKRRAELAAPTTYVPNRWPFVESPGDFTERLASAYKDFGNLLAAVRCVLIEQPPELAQGAVQPEQAEKK